MPYRKEKMVKGKGCCQVEGIAQLPEEVERGLARIGGLDRLVKSLPGDEELLKISERHNALSDPIRQKILHSLASCDLCPCILKGITELSDSRLSYHLNVLEEAGLVASKSKQRWRIYSLTDKALAQISCEAPGGGPE